MSAHSNLRNVIQTDNEDSKCTKNDMCCQYYIYKASGESRGGGPGAWAPPP